MKIEKHMIGVENVSFQLNDPIFYKFWSSLIGSIVKYIITNKTNSTS